MYQSAANRRPPAGPGLNGPDLTATLAELLVANERAAARGAPLLTDAGLAHVRGILLAWANTPEPGAADARPH
jgi:hypothetical protein